MSGARPLPDVQWREGRGFTYALLMGLIAVAFDGLQGNSVSITHETIRQARGFVHSSSRSPFDLRVFAFPKHVDLTPDDINELAREQIVVARSEGSSATERAEAFIHDFLRRANAERENFDAFAEQTEAFRRRVEAARKGE